MLQKIPRDAVQKLCLAKQIYPGRTLYVQESFKDACASSFFLWLTFVRRRQIS